MKCIRAVKATKQYKIGEVKRVSDKEAESATRDGYWQYVAKYEWKSLNKKLEQESSTIVEQPKETNKTNKKSKA